MDKCRCTYLRSPYAHTPQYGVLPDTVQRCLSRSCRVALHRPRRPACSPACLFRLTCSSRLVYSLLLVLAPCCPPDAEPVDDAGFGSVSEHTSLLVRCPRLRPYSPLSGVARRGVSVVLCILSESSVCSRLQVPRLALLPPAASSFGRRGSIIVVFFTPGFVPQALSLAQQLLLSLLDKGPECSVLLLLYFVLRLPPFQIRLPCPPSSRGREPNSCMSPRASLFLDSPVLAPHPSSLDR